MAASEPIPIFQIEPMSFYKGVYIGQMIASTRLRFAAKEWFNLLDLSGKYTSNSYSAKYVSGSSTNYTEFAAGEHPLNWICEHSYAADSEAVAVISHMHYALSLSEGDEVRFEVIFPTIKYTGLDYEMQRVNFYMAPPCS